jgi:hypothetical protein
MVVVHVHKGKPKQTTTAQKARITKRRVQMAVGRSAGGPEAGATSRSTSFGSLAISLRPQLIKIAHVTILSMTDGMIVGEKSMIWTDSLIGASAVLYG